DRMPVEQQITQRPTPDGGHHRDHQYAHQVESLPPRGQRAADGEDCNAEQVEEIEEGHKESGPGAIAEKLGIAKRELRIMNYELRAITGCELRIMATARVIHA